MKKQAPVYFVGKGPVSKSLFLRALLVQSYFPYFQIKTVAGETCEAGSARRLGNNSGVFSPTKEQGLAKNHNQRTEQAMCPRRHGGVPADTAVTYRSSEGPRLGSGKQPKNTSTTCVPPDTGGDVRYMKEALEQWQSRLKSHSPLVMDCGLSGAVLRFLALRVARGRGLSAFCPTGAKLGSGEQSKNTSTTCVPPDTGVLGGQAYLFKRPMEELLSILGQLSCEGEIKKADFLSSHAMGLFIKSRGWQPRGDAILVSHNRSSQFASAILLNSWLLPFDLYLSLEGLPVSFSYLQMTLEFLQSLGMQINTISMGREYHIPKGQKLKKPFYELEQDMGCLFALSAMTVCGGEVRFTDWPEKSLQPDFVFPALLKKMGFSVQYSHRRLKISQGQVIYPITHNMRDFPDLFPVLSALCVFSEGESYLYGASHLRYKESNRLKKTAELLTKVGKTVHVKDDGLIISGPVPNKKIKAFEFNPAEDHRMAMSAGVLKKAGFPIRILNPQVVNKSFPHFWNISNLDPLS